LAAALNNLSNTLTTLGRPADALPADEEAVAICRELVAANPDLYRPYLAQSLVSLANALAGLNRSAEADAVRDEAAKLGQWS
jgi:hypothetical protein